MVRGDSSARQKTEALKEKQDSLFEKVRRRAGWEKRAAHLFFLQVDHTREFVLAAEGGLLMGKIVAEQALNVDVALSSDSPGEFVGKVKAWMARVAPNDEADEEADDEADDEAAKWSALARMAATHYPMCPGATFAYGPIPTVPVVRAQRKARGPEDNLEKKKQVKEMEQEADPEAVNLATTRQVDDLARKLHVAGQCPVWQVVANPQSMAQTVEHMFHLSFLVKEGKARVAVDNDRGVMVKSCKPPGPAEENLERVQAIVRIDKAQLNAAIERYRIHKPFLEHRESHAPRDLEAPEAEDGASGNTSSKSSNKRAPAPTTTPGSAVAPTQLVDSVSAVTPLVAKRRKKAAD